MRFIIAILSILVLSFWQTAEAGTYRFKPDDVLKVSVWQEPKLNSQVVVAPDGSIAMPLIGRIEVGGQSGAEIEQTIKERLSKTYKGDLDVTVTYAGRSRDERDADNDPKFYIIGEVNREGQFSITTETTILQALALGGGLSPFAAERRIQVHRKIGDRDALLNFDYRKFKRGHNPAQNIFLRPGDVVVVPSNGQYE